MQIYEAAYVRQEGLWLVYTFADDTMCGPFTYI